MAELQTWCIEHRLQYKEINEYIFEIAGEKYIQVIGDDENKLFDNDVNFIFKPEELLEIINNEIGLVVFEFGESYYYTKFDYAKFYKNFLEENICTIAVQFNDLKHLGKAVQRTTHNFPQLGIHSEYELMNGSYSPKAWVTKSYFLDAKTIAICDKNTLGGTLAFQITAAEKGMKCILGETIVIRYQFDDEEKADEVHEGKVYATSEKGWRSLLRINKVINVDNKGAFIDEDQLLKYGEGVIFVFSTNSIINRMEESYDIDDKINLYRKAFDHIYYQYDTVEFNSDEYDLDNLIAYKRMKDLYWGDVKFVMINDAYYLDKGEHQIKKYFNTFNKKAMPESKDQYLKSYDEMEDKTKTLFETEDEAEAFLEVLLKNTSEMADLCDYTIPTGQHKLPKFEAVTIAECHFDNAEYKRRLVEFEEIYQVDPMDNEAIFFRLIELGIEEKLKQIDNMSEYMARIEKEATVIVNAGFIDYFLILWDLIRWAKEEGIMVGVGRGSVGGSMLAYLLDIIDIDPIQYDLLFERFLNETRVSGERAKAADALPDIDLDFESRRRDDVKKYLEFKYGSDRICSIGTYNGLKLKSAVTEFSKADGLSFQYMKTITKMIENQLKYEWKDLFKYAMKNKLLYSYVQKNHKVINLMKPILEQARSGSIHASAVIIVPKEDEHGNPMTVFDWMPIKWIEKDGQEFFVSEWSGKYIDRAGFLKEDILGLDQLDKFSNMLKLVKENTGEQLLLREIPLDDKKTYKLFKKGWNEDIFQMNKDNFKAYSRKVSPDNIDDLTAMNALWRPGPMSSNAHVDFYEIKHGRKKAVFDYGLKEVTEATQGLYVYQEQIMKAVNVLGKLTLTESDEVRTVMKKFDKVKMKTYTDKFIAGAIENGCGATEAEAIWQKLERFSGYGFNKSHSAAYALMSYQAQWFKANYPIEFWTTALQFAKSDEVVNLISEIRQVSHITIKPPHINKSDFNFKGDRETESIYWSLLQIKNIADKGCMKIIDKRKEGGPFKNMSDFMTRMKGTGIGKDKLKYLVLAGAFDETYKAQRPANRKMIIKKYYGLIGETLPEEYDGDSSNEDYFWVLRQKQLTGFGIIDFKEMIKTTKGMARTFVPANNFQKCEKWDEVTIGGQIKEIIPRTGKKKGSKEFGTLALNSNNDVVHVVLWSETWADVKSSLLEAEKNQSVVFITGKVNMDDFKGQKALYSNNDSRVKVF